MRRIRQQIKQFTSKSLDLPKDVILNLPRITLIGFQQMYIENYNSVLQFNDTFLHLKLSNKELKIVGEKLVIRQIWTEEILIEGQIKELKYLD